MRIGETDLETRIREDEIWPRLEDAWRRQLVGGAHPSPEIYRSALSDVLRSFVADKREGATLALRQFGERHSYDQVQDRLAQAAQGVPVAVPRPAGERKLGAAEQRMIDQAKAEGRARARIGCLVALLAALVLLLGYVLDRTPAKLTWNEIPQTVTATVAWRDPWLTEPAASSLLGTSWRMEQSRRREEFDDKLWFVALRTQGCQTAIDQAAQAESAHAQQLAQSLTQALQITAHGPAQISHHNRGYNQYIASVHYSIAPVDPMHAGRTPESSTAPTDSTSATAPIAKAWFETAELVVPNGLSAVRVVMGHYTVAEQAPDPELLVERATRTISGRTILCKAPTIWGWWFERDRYLE